MAAVAAALTLAAGEMMLLLLLRIGGFATIATIRWLLRCEGDAGRKAVVLPLNSVDSNPHP